MLRVKGMVALSGYENDIYKKLEENGWIRNDFEVYCNITRKNMKNHEDKSQFIRKECVWRNPACIREFEKQQKENQLQLIS